jgi:hypothetical protein
MGLGESHGAAVAPGRGVLHRIRPPARACAAGAARAALLIALALTPHPGWGQISPNCQLNGRPLACAITPGPDDPPAANGLPTTSSLTVMYSDGQAFRLVKQEARCRQQGPRSLCPATITPRNGFGTAVAASYRGLAYEGGYRNEYDGGGIRIVYFFVD